MSPASTLPDRPRAYFNDDGLGELGVALFCLGATASHYLDLPAVSVLVLAAAIHFGTRAIKARWTYPRTGFVEYRMRDAVWIPAFVIAPAAALIAIALAVVLRHPSGLGAVHPIFGAVVTVSYAWGVARAVRWKWTVVLCMALATLYLALTPPAGMELWPMAVYGLLLLISGAITLFQYTRTPPARDNG